MNNEAELTQSQGGVMVAAGGAWARVRGDRGGGRAAPVGPGGGGSEAGVGARVAVGAGEGGGGEQDQEQLRGPRA